MIHIGDLKIAIKKYCFECSGYSYNEVKKCKCIECPLYLYRNISINYHNTSNAAVKNKKKFNFKVFKEVISNEEVNN